jgi:hypothetical protein
LFGLGEVIQTEGCFLSRGCGREFAADEMHEVDIVPSAASVTPARKCAPQARPTCDANTPIVFLSEDDIAIHAPEWIGKIISLKSPAS